MENIGALWIKQGKNGEFWKGNIEIEKETGEKEKVNVMVFRNKKNKETQPDFKICKPDENFLKEEKQEEEYIPNDEEQNPFEITSDDDLPF